MNEKLPEAPTAEEFLNESSDEIGKEIEVKYILNPNKLPSGLQKALLDGDDHEAIHRKGRITQLYLPVEDNILRIVLEVIKNHVGCELTDEEIKFFSHPENVAEIRILQREQDHLEEARPYAEAVQNDKNSKSLVYPDAFQLTIKGVSLKNGAVRSNIETPITTDKDVAKGVVNLLESLRIDGKPLSWQDRVKVVEKMWYDLKIDDPNNPGETKIVELDVFPDLHYLAVAEVEFDNEEDLETFRNGSRPQWLETDITDNEQFKVRNLAGHTFETLSPPVQSILQEIRGNFEQFYQPTVLGDDVKDIPGQENYNFAVVGSFQQWLPQFRRITQDLNRRSRGVYPPITTLDVARRRISSDDSDVAFRIEAEEGTPLKDAERNYLNRIKSSDALYVVAPEGRLGRSSTHETVYAISRDRKVFLANEIKRMSVDAPLYLQTLVHTLLNEVFSGHTDFKYSHTNVTPHVKHYAERVYPTRLLEDITRKNVADLLQTSIDEDVDNNEYVAEAVEKNLGKG